MENVKENVNPFATDISKDFLFNISTGQAADENVAEFLLNAEKMGDEQRQQFIKECIEDSNRFERVIKQNKIINFASMQKKKKITLAGKVTEVHLQRDLFAQLLCISLEKELDVYKRQAPISSHTWQPNFKTPKQWVICIR